MRINRIAVLTVGSLLFFGCATAEPEPSVRLTGTSRVSSQQLQVTRLWVGGLLEVTLDGNHTTGYSWQLAGNQSGILRLEKQEYISDHSSLCGSPGSFHWVFRAVKPGREMLEFRYYRPWEAYDPKRDVHCRYSLEVTE